MNSGSESVRRVRRHGLPYYCYRPGQKIRVLHRRFQQCVFRIVHVSGSIRKCEEEAIRRAKALLSAAKEAESGQASSALARLFHKTSTADLNVVDVDKDDDDESMVDG